MKNSIYLSVYTFVIFMAVKPTISEGEEENEVIEEKSKLLLTQRINYVNRDFFRCISR